MPATSKSLLQVRNYSVAIIAAVLAVSGAHAQAPIAGQTTNMVTGTQWPNGDPFLQRQNEPSMAISSENPMHVVSGDNDYRTVDVPFPLGSNQNAPETGDAWLGFFTSQDGGFTWASTLVPGYPQDVSQAGSLCGTLPIPTGPQANCSPIKGYAAAADPTVRAAPSGMFIYAGLAFNRDEQSSAIFIARYRDYNNAEFTSPVAYLDTNVIAQSTPASGTFLDKPTVAIQYPGASPLGNCPNIPNASDFNVIVAWTVFTGAQQYPAQIWYSWSDDCGATFSAPQQVSDYNFGNGAPYPTSGAGVTGAQLNQGAQIAIDPSDSDDFYIFWRQFKDTTSPAVTVPDGIAGVNVNLSNFFSEFPITINQVFLEPFDSSTPLPIAPNGYIPINAFDQETEANAGGAQITTPTEFRTNAYPAVAVDSNENLFIAWAQRGGTSPTTPDTTTSRISYFTTPICQTEGGFCGLGFSVGNGGTGSSYAVGDVDDNGYQPGHQIMPAMAYSAGKLTVAWYDFRDDDQTLIYTDTSIPGTYTITLQPDGTLVFGPYVADPPSPYAGSLRHTVDVRAAQMATPPLSSFSPSIQISSYQYGTLNGTNPSAAGALSQLQYDAPNLPLFETGSAPFMGDYIDVAGPTFINDPSEDGWRPNTQPGDPDYTRVVWADNRDVVAPADGNWQNYTPVALYGATSTFNPMFVTPSCQVGQTGMRNQNLYTAPVTPGLIIGAQGNSKNTDNHLVGFALTLQNTTSGTLYFTLSLPVPGESFYASFVQNDAAGFLSNPSNPPTPTLSLIVAIPPLSTATRTVFVAEQESPFPFFVTATQVADAQGDTLAPPGITTSVLLNGDFENTGNLTQPPNPVNTSVTPPVQVTLFPVSTADSYDAILANPNIANPNIANPNIANPNIANPNIANPNIANPNIANPNIANPNIANITITNADIMNPNIANPNIANPNIANPNIANPNIANPNIANPNIANPNIANTSLSDASYVITNFGNTTAGYTVLLQNNLPSTPQGVNVQLVVSNVYGTPVADGCVLTTQASLVPLINDTAPVLFQAGTVNTVNPPTAVNADTFVLAPGASALVTIRAYYPPGSGYNPLTAVTPVVYSQAIDVATLSYNSGGQPAGPPALTVTTPVLSSATATVPYSQLLSASGGTGTGYTWSVPQNTTSTSPDGTPSVANGLPPGLTIGTNDDGTGLISGTPADTFSGMVTIQVKDSGGFSATRVLNFTIQPASNLQTQIVSLVPSTSSAVPYYGAFTISAISNAGTTPMVTVTGECSQLSSAGGVYSLRMTSGAGNCSISATWPATNTYAAAYAEISVTAVPAVTTLSLTGAPSVAAQGSQFVITAVTNVGATPPVTASGGCSINSSTNQVSINGTGACNFSSTVAGTANYSTATANLSVPIGTATQTSTTVTSSVNPSTIGQSVTFTAIVSTGTSGTPTGSITFSIDSGASIPGVAAACPPASPANSLCATYTTSALTGGSHTVTATYTPAGGFQGSNGSLAPPEMVNMANQATLTVTGPSSISYGSTGTAMASGGSGTGALSFSAGSSTGCAVSGISVSVTNASGTCSLTATKAADNNYNSITSAPFNVTLVKANTSTAITSNTPNHATVGQPVTVSFTVSPAAPATVTPSGNVTVSDGVGDSCMATVAAGQCSLTINSAGSITLTAAYAGNTNYNGSASPGVAESTSKAFTVTTITAHTPNPSVAGQPVTISFTVKPIAPGGGTPSGNVVITDLLGGTCTVPVAAGSCTITFGFAAPRLLVATYLGNSNYDGSITAQIPQNVVDFAIVASPTTEKVVPGGKTTYTITLTPLNDFSGTVSLACSGAPANTTCTVSPNSIALSGLTPKSSTATITTTNSTKAGSYTLTLTGTYGSGNPSTGGLTHSANVTLTVE